MKVRRPPMPTSSSSALRFSRSMPIRAPISSAVAKSRMTSRSIPAFMPPMLQAFTSLEWTTSSDAWRARQRIPIGPSPPSGSRRWHSASTGCDLRAQPCRPRPASAPRGAGRGAPQHHGLARGRARAARIARASVAAGADRHRLRPELRARADPRAGRRDRGYVSVYARHRDYHDVLKGRLKELAGWLAARAGAVKVFVDTAPVLEKPLAQQAGLGWQGKHTNLVSRELGSWLFLGEILTDLDLPPDPPERDHCGSCRRCLDVCPTGALPAPYRLVRLPPALPHDRA